MPISGQPEEKQIFYYEGCEPSQGKYIVSFVRKPIRTIGNCDTCGCPAQEEFYLEATRIINADTSKEVPKESREFKFIALVFEIRSRAKKCISCANKEKGGQKPSAVNF